MNITYSQQEGSFVNGTSVQYNCDQGYDILGNEKLLCVKGQWTPSQSPTCTPSEDYY